MGGDGRRTGRHGGRPGPVSARRPAGRRRGPGLPAEGRARRRGHPRRHHAAGGHRGRAARLRLHRPAGRHAPPGRGGPLQLRGPRDRPGAGGPLLRLAERRAGVRRRVPAVPGGRLAHRRGRRQRAPHARGDDGRRRPRGPGPARGGERVQLRAHQRGRRRGRPRRVLGRRPPQGRRPHDRRRRRRLARPGRAARGGGGPAAVHPGGGGRRTRAVPGGRGHGQRRPGPEGRPAEPHPHGGPGSGRPRQPVPRAVRVGGARCRGAGHHRRGRPDRHGRSGCAGADRPGPGRRGRCASGHRGRAAGGCWCAGDGTPRPRPGRWSSTCGRRPHRPPARPARCPTRAPTPAPSGRSGSQIAAGARWSCPNG
jgi:hypothetical protein